VKSADAARLWTPTVAMMLVSLVSYIDRNTLALLAPTVLEDLHLTAEQYGWAISAFSVAYTLGNPAWGAVLDRIGLRIGMLVAVGLWTLASASHAFVFGLAGLACARALLGLGEGATFPGGLRAATQTLPEHLRSRGIAVAYSGGSLGAILTPIVVTPIAAAWGWRGAFLATGVAGACWIALWGVVGKEGVHAPTPPSRALALARDPRLLAFIGLYSLGGLPLGIVLYGAPLYLSRAMHLSQWEIGKWMWLPPLGWEIGFFAWGFRVDARTRKGIREPVPVLAALALSLLALPLGAVPSLPGIAVPMAVFVAATFSAAGFLILGIAYATREFGTDTAGFVAGVGAGSWSAFVALLMPVFGRLFDRGEYGLGFSTAAVAPLLGVLAWIGIHRLTAPRSTNA
jgi:ACS family hexuronate transporter-like MFS transporter